MGLFPGLNEGGGDYPLVGQEIGADTLSGVGAAVAGDAWEPVPENDFDALTKRFVVREKDLSEYYAWLELIVLDGNHPDMPYLTDRCDEFVSDAMEYNWGYDESIEEAELKRKWAKRYDLRYATFDHLFETGNDGWVNKKLSRVEYLGEVNQGEWFRLTIEGGPGENNWSGKVDRVVKIIRVNGDMLIDNVVGL